MSQASISHVDIVQAADFPHDPWLLVGEIVHRVANQYAAAIGSISMAAKLCASSEAKSVLAGVALKLRDYADVHRALQPPEGAAPTDLAQYLRQLCSAFVRSSLSERAISLTLIEETIKLDPQQCWRVGLIVSELITNAARHGLRGASGMIVLEISTNNGFVQCLVTDNGRGVANFIPGHGSRIVEALADDLGGHIERSSGPRGAAVLLSFPQRPARRFL